MKTIEQVREMTDDELCIAIAAQQGWGSPCMGIPNPFMREPAPCGVAPVVGGEASPTTTRRWTHLPSYASDLNPIHEAVMSLDAPTREHSYRLALAKAVGVIGIADWEISLACLDKMTNATARQRAEAFYLVTQ